MHLNFHRKDRVEIFLVIIQQDEKCTVVGTPRVRFFRWHTPDATPNESELGPSKMKTATEEDSRTYAEAFDVDMHMDELPPYRMDSLRVRPFLPTCAIVLTVNNLLATYTRRRT